MMSQHQLRSVAAFMQEVEEACLSHGVTPGGTLAVDISNGTGGHQAGFVHVRRGPAKSWHLTFEED